MNVISRAVAILLRHPANLASKITSIKRGQTGAFEVNNKLLAGFA
jgi:hypothetical protein